RDDLLAGEPGPDGPQRDLREHLAAQPALLEIRELQRNFLDEFKSIDADPHSRGALVKDFDQIFYRHADGSYTQRPGLFEGKALPDGRRFAGMSATYAPDIAPDDDVKARFTLSYMLSHKYGSTAKGRLFNFYGVVPEKGFPIYQAADIAKVFTYTGPEALKLDTYEFYSRGFNSPSHDTFFTRMYWDYSNNAWMTTVATPDIADASGKHRILACVDVLLDELMQRIAHPAIQGAHSTLFLDDGEGTLIYHPDFMDAIKKSEGHASIKSLKIENDYPLLTASTTIVHGKVVLIDTKDAIIAVGHIPETPAVLAIHYPKALMQPAILQNLAIVITLGFLTLLVEIFIIRSILQNQVATPLSRLIRATRLLGASRERLDTRDLPTQSQDEIGELARDFSHMAKRVQDVHEQLESKVYERTVALEAANQQLTALSVTDKLTGIANRRRYDEVLANEWQRAQRTGGYLMLAMLDVDWFKKYNDHYGHQAGDDCLRSVAQTIAAHANRAGDLVARYGGEEFALVITTISPENALTFAQRLCEALEKVNLPHAMSPFGHVTVSIGVACATYAEYESAEDLLRKADEALYAAKEQGRNQATLYVRPAN
ncbi:MAG: diguanylate cyclase, partial [Methylophilaceae bacterium]